MINWNFAHKYWVVSITLKQALGSRDDHLSEQAQERVFIAVAAIISGLCLADSFLFWFAMSTQNETLLSVSNYTFSVYGICLTVSLIFLLVGICQISSLLKQFEGLRLNEHRMLLHVCFLFVNVIFNVFLLIVYMAQLFD